MSNVVALSTKQPLPKGTALKGQLKQMLAKSDAAELRQLRIDYQKLTEKLAEMFDEQNTRLEALESQNLHLVDCLQQLATLVLPKPS